MHYLHTFPEHKSEHWMKPGLKFLFHFVDISELNIFTVGILAMSFYH